MKLSERILSPWPLLWIYPLLLVIPNVWLALSEPWTLLSKLTGIVLPLGLYYVMMGLCRRSGLAVLLSLPVAVLCAFQIVLLYLYGESIIAIDMFMNVATTNVGEVTELLSNLWKAIATVLVLYLPPLALSVFLLVRGRRAEEAQLRHVRVAGITLVSVGLVLAAGAYSTADRYSMRRELFPLNVVCNLCEAVNRVNQAEGYFDSSRNFRFHAVSLRPDSVPEVYVLVIGETSRADNWQLFGYDRPNNPRLSVRDGVLCYPYTLSESNTTHKSVPMLLSNLRADNFGDSVYRVKSIFEVFNEVGVRTLFLSNQAENRSYIDFFSSQAGECRRLCDDGAVHHDHELLEHLRQYLDSCTSGRVFVTMHTYGSHYCYHERYTSDFRRFTPDDATVATAHNRADLLNAYDNSILYTDAMLDSVIEILDSRGCRSVMLYTADHGEDIFDDDRQRFLHASPTPTYWQLHVPALMWMSAQFRSAYPGLFEAAADNRCKQVSSTASVFDTLLDLAGIAADGHRPGQSLCNTGYREPVRRYLNDYNEGVELDRSGLRAPDFVMLQRSGFYK